MTSPTQTPKTEPSVNTSQESRFGDETIVMDMEAIAKARCEANHIPTQYYSTTEDEFTPKESPANTLTQDFTVKINNKTYNIIAIEDERNVTFRLPEQLKDNEEAQLVCNFLNEAATVAEFRNNFILGNYRVAIQRAIGFFESNVDEAMRNLNSKVGPIMGEELDLSPIPYKTTYEEGEIPTEEAVKKLEEQVSALGKKRDRLFAKGYDLMLDRDVFWEGTLYNNAAYIVVNQYIEAKKAYDIAHAIFEKSENGDRQTSAQ